MSTFSRLITPLLCAGMISTAVYAEEQNVSLNEVETTATEGATDKADELITNRRFRASNGSLTKLSMNVSMSYNGGSLEKPFAADRPNISNAGDTTSISGIAGTVNGSYRLSALDRLSFGAGIQMLAPFNDTIDTKDARAQREFDENQGELDVANPYLSYSHMNRFFGVQTILSAGVTQFTASNLTDVGYNAAANFAANTMYDFGGSRFSIGALFVYDRYFFDKDDQQFLASQNETVFGFLPQAEFVINDTFNLRTIVRSNWYQNDRDRGPDKYTTRPVTQSVGLGISLGRDVFLYPNIQFPYENLKVENTNIGLTANINLF